MQHDVNGGGGGKSERGLELGDRRKSWTGLGLRKAASSLIGWGVEEDSPDTTPTGYVYVCVCV